MSRVSKSDFKAQLQCVQQEPVVPAQNPFGRGSCSSIASSSTATPTHHSSAVDAGTAPRAAARRAAPAKSYAVPSVAEYRGTTALAHIKPSKNVTNDPAQTSLPMRELSRKEMAPSVNRQPNPITAHQVNALATGFGSVFIKENCKTTRGWQSGKFV